VVGRHKKNSGKVKNDELPIIFLIARADIISKEAGVVCRR